MLTQKLRRVIDEGVGYGLELEGISAAHVARSMARLASGDDSAAVSTWSVCKLARQFRRGERCHGRAAVVGSVRARAKDAGMSNSVDTFEPGAVRIWRAERDGRKEV
jgi:hypothetical protein